MRGKNVMENNYNNMNQQQFNNENNGMAYPPVNKNRAMVAVILFIPIVFFTTLFQVSCISIFITDLSAIGYEGFRTFLDMSLLVGIIGLAIITITNFVGMQAGVALVDLFIAAEIIDEYRCLKAFTVETEKVIEECKMIWESGKLGKQPNNKILAQIMKAYIHYESTLAYASVILDSDIYNELNESLEEEWEEIKKRYNMKG